MSESSTSSFVDDAEDLYERYGFTYRTLGKCLFAVISVASIIGNGLTICAVWKFQSLQTAGNYVITSLAVSDFLQAFGFGIEAILHAFSPSICSIYYDIGQQVVRYISVISSLLHLLLIAGDRFIAIMFPLRYNAIFTAKVARNAIVVTWATATAFSSSFFGWAFIDGGAYQCDFYHVPHIHQVLLSGITYVAVALFLVVIYTRIALVARKHRLQIIHNQVTSGGGTGVNKTSSMLLFILMVYVLSWTPYGIIWIFTFGTGQEDAAIQIVTTISAELGFANCCMNAFIYAWKSKPFYEAYKKLLCLKCRE